MSEAPRYPKHVFWSDEDEGFIAVASDLPGASAFGETEAEALAELDQAIDAWIEAARAAGNAVPAPSRPASASLPSGKVLVRMPKGLHQRAALCAEREAVSLNQFIVACLAEAVGERSHAPVERAVMSEAVRLAKEVVKNEIRKANMKVAAKDITAAAKAFVEGDPSYIEQAKANIAEHAQSQRMKNPDIKMKDARKPLPPLRSPKAAARAGVNR